MNAQQMARQLYVSYLSELAQGNTTRTETMSALVSSGKLLVKIGGRDSLELAQAMRLVWKRLQGQAINDEVEATMMEMEVQADREGTFRDETNKFNARRAMEGRG